MRYILASGSPRRIELLGQLVKEFDIIPADIDERFIENDIEEKYSGKDMVFVASEMVKELSRAKASFVWEKLEHDTDETVIGADTAVAVSDEII